MTDLVPLKPLTRPIRHIDKNTPICVVTSWVSRLGWTWDHAHIDDDVYRLELVEKSQVNVHHISTDPAKWKHQDLSFVARFINPFETGWTRCSLERSFNHVMSDPSSQVSSFKYGPINHLHPDNHDDIMCYNFLFDRGYNLTSSLNEYQLITLCILDGNPLGYLMGNISHFNMGMVTRDYSIVKSPWENITWEPNGVVNPRSSKEAVILGLTKGYDLSLTDAPLLEYYFNKDRTDDEIYECVGKTTTHIHKINKLRLRFKLYFNPLIPLQYYDRTSLIGFSWIEGIDFNRSDEDIYDDLCTRSLLDNFHHLLQPEVSKDEVETSRYLHQTFSEEDPVSVVSYGVLAHNNDEYVTKMRDGGVIAYTLDELIHMFKTYSDFTDPNFGLNGTTFPDYAIGKLMNISLGIIKSDRVKKETKDKANLLIQEIYRIKQYKQGLHDRVSKFKEVYDILDKEEQEKIVDAFKILLDAGMYMRSWEGPGHPYPITTIKYRPIEEIEDLVDETLSSFYRISNGLAVKLSDLPLYSYEKDRFNPSASVFEGITIGERVNKIMKGETVTESYSCVRLSSNWIVSSAFFYLQLLDRRPFFIIEEMTFTS